MQGAGDHGECKFLTTLGEIIDKNKTFYAGCMGSGGLPKVQVDLFHQFANDGGFLLLQQNVEEEHKSIPLDIKTITSLLKILHVISDFAKGEENRNRETGVVMNIFGISNAIMPSLQSWTMDHLKQLPKTGIVFQTMSSLFYFFDSVSDTGHRNETSKFYKSWSNFCSKLISEGGDWKRVGLEMASTELLIASVQCWPLPYLYIVQGAGVEECNGEYEYDGSVTPEGFIPR